MFIGGLWVTQSGTRKFRPSATQCHLASLNCEKVAFQKCVFRISVSIWMYNVKYFKFGGNFKILQCYPTITDVLKYMPSKYISI